MAMNRPGRWKGLPWSLLTLYIFLDLLATALGMGVPFLKDKVYGNYNRSMAEVYGAAIQVINFNGAVVKESTDFNPTNQTSQVKTIIGKVMERNVYVRVEAVDPKVTQIVAQARTTGGGSDMPLSHELEKQVALKLAH